MDCYSNPFELFWKPNESIRRINLSDGEILSLTMVSSVSNYSWPTFLQQQSDGENKSANSPYQTGQKNVSISTEFIQKVSVSDHSSTCVNNNI